MNPGTHLSLDVGTQRMGPGEGSFRDRGGEAGEEEVKKQNENFTAVSLCHPNLFVRILVYNYGCTLESGEALFKEVPMIAPSHQNPYSYFLLGQAQNQYFLWLPGGSDISQG